jgi:hypothetical protein
LRLRFAKTSPRPVSSFRARRATTQERPIGDPDDAAGEGLGVSGYHSSIIMWTENLTIRNFVGKLYT